MEVLQDPSPDQKHLMTKDCVAVIHANKYVHIMLVLDWLEDR